MSDRDIVYLVLAGIELALAVVIGVFGEPVGVALLFATAMAFCSLTVIASVVPRLRTYFGLEDFYNGG